MDERIIKPVDITEAEIRKSIIKRYNDTLRSVSGVDGFMDFLYEFMSNDMKRYFYAPSEQQDAIKGQYARTKEIYDVLKNIIVTK